jgi:thiol-disulfide isomerase/thioredoxin
MLERLLIAAIFIGLGIITWIAFNRLSVRRAAGIAPQDPVLAPLHSGTPAILYFTTPFCEPCRTLQKPALNKLKTDLGSGIQIIQVDACEQPDVADRWGVLSAPTTFILDSTLTPRQVNRGVVSAEMLKKQIEQSSKS